MTSSGHARHLAAAFAALAVAAARGARARRERLTDVTSAPVKLSPAQDNQALAALRARSASWHNRAMAEADGYTADVGCSDERTEAVSASQARGMGYHTANMDLLLDDHTSLVGPDGRIVVPG